jgi:hypothetical protein
MKNQTVTVADLKDGILHPKYAGRFLLCRVCGERGSANKGDYFTLSEDYVFTHCAKNMKLVTEKTVYTEVRL